VARPRPVVPRVAGLVPRAAEVGADGTYPVRVAFLFPLRLRLPCLRASHAALRFVGAVRDPADRTSSGLIRRPPCEALAVSGVGAWRGNESRDGRVHPLQTDRTGGQLVRRFLRDVEERRQPRFGAFDGGGEVV
jgi:hypothetical protein